MQLVSLVWMTTKLMAFKLLQYGASEKALLKQRVATWFVLFLNWVQGKLPGESVLWVVPWHRFSWPWHEGIPLTSLSSDTGVTAASSLPFIFRPLSNTAPCMYLHPGCPLGGMARDPLHCAPHPRSFSPHTSLFPQQKTARQVADLTL